MNSMNFTKFFGKLFIYTIQHINTIDPLKELIHFEIHLIPFRQVIT